MRILITGGAGFIGSHLAERLVHRGDDVIVVDDFNDFYDPAIKTANLEKVRDQIQLVRESITNAGAMEQIMADTQPEVVVHLAARAGVRPSIANPRAYVQTNVMGTLNVLEAMRITGISKLVFASSSSVYGLNKKVPFSESDPIQETISPYAASKLSAEQLCCNYAHLHGVQTVCLRFFTVYGPRQRPDLAIAKFTRRIDEGTPIRRYGDGSASRDYTYITDIVDGIVGALDYAQTRFEIINLGGSKTTTLARLIQLIERALGKRAVVEKYPDQAGDVPMTFADISKAERLLGYRPKVAIERGIEQFVAWCLAEHHREVLSPM